MAMSKKAVQAAVVRINDLIRVASQGPYTLQELKPAQQEAINLWLETWILHPAGIAKDILNQQLDKK